MTAGGWADTILEWARAHQDDQLRLTKWQELTLRQIGAALEAGHLVYPLPPAPPARARAEEVHAALVQATGRAWTVQHLGHGLVLATDEDGRTTLAVDPAADRP